MRAGHQLEVFGTVGSTNEIALDAAGQGAREGWFVSREQTAGRGRRGRAWQTEAGNLAATFLCRLPARTRGAESLGFVAGVALVEALLDLLPVPGTDLGLKWPNDVLAAGKKLAGILLEARSGPDGGMVVAVGIGVNVVSAPEGLPYPAACLKEMGLEADAGDVFRALSGRWAINLQLWDGGAGSAAILEKWRSHALGLGRPVSVETPRGRISGVLAGIDERGHIVIGMDNGHQEVVSAGDVQFSVLPVSHQHDASA